MVDSIIKLSNPVSRNSQKVIKNTPGNVMIQEVSCKSEYFYLFKNIYPTLFHNSTVKYLQTNVKYSF